MKLGLALHPGFLVVVGNALRAFMAIERCLYVCKQLCVSIDFC